MRQPQDKNLPILIEKVTRIMETCDIPWGSLFRKKPCWVPSRASRSLTFPILPDQEGLLT